MARQQIRMWLDNRKGDEAWLLEQIPVAKKRRLFSRFVREGISLMVYLQEWGIKAQSVYDLLNDLRAGEIDRLFEMFPHIKNKLQTEPVSPVKDGAGELGEIKGLLEIIAANQKPNGLAMASQPQTGKQIAKAGFVSMPVYDDDDDLPLTVTAKSVDATANFLGSLNNIVMH